MNDRLVAYKLKFPKELMSLDVLDFGPGWDHLVCEMMYELAGKAVITSLRSRCGALSVGFSCAPVPSLFASATEVVSRFALISQHTCETCSRPAVTGPGWKQICKYCPSTTKSL